MSIAQLAVSSLTFSGLVRIASKFRTHRQVTAMVRGFYMFVVVFVLHPENDEGNYV